MSFPRKRESIVTLTWMPAFAGMTIYCFKIIVHFNEPPEICLLDIFEPS